MKKFIRFYAVFLLLPAILSLQMAFSASASADLPSHVRAVYFPPYALNRRAVDIYVHQARQLGLNAVVLHLKNPRGKLFWPSRVPGARQHVAPGAVTNLDSLIETLKANQIMTIAKLDVFADHALVSDRPGLGLQDTETGRPWKDKNGLFWANPYDRRVWNYVINLARELAALGFDEIQFDYVRFPSDGDLGKIVYPHHNPDISRSQCIAAFLESASEQLHPLGVQLSAAVFGLVAWKKYDFGVGQVLEQMSPALDVICPMFYPSHFPPGFLGKTDPGRYPGLIMRLSTQRLLRRTQIQVRPWIQDFWYGPAQIEAQLKGLEAAGTNSWAAWNPSGKYKSTFTVLSRRSGVRLTLPKLYPALADLRSLPDCMITAAKKPVNLTCYRKGYSVVSLQPPDPASGLNAATPAGLIMTLDESILDRILTRRRIHFGPRTSKRVKAGLVARLMCRDLEADSRRMRPRQIFIDWDGDCRFSYKVPPNASASFRKQTPVTGSQVVARRHLLRDKLETAPFLAD